MPRTAQSGSAEAGGALPSRPSVSCFPPLLHGRARAEGPRPGPCGPWCRTPGAARAGRRARKGAGAMTSATTMTTALPAEQAGSPDAPRPRGRVRGRHPAVRGGRARRPLLDRAHRHPSPSTCRVPGRRLHRDPGAQRTHRLVLALPAVPGGSWAPRRRARYGPTSSTPAPCARCARRTPRSAGPSRAGWAGWSPSGCTPPGSGCSISTPHGGGSWSERRVRPESVGRADGDDPRGPAVGPSGPSAAGAPRFAGPMPETHELSAPAPAAGPTVLALPGEIDLLTVPAPCRRGSTRSPRARAPTWCWTSGRPSSSTAPAWACCAGRGTGCWPGGAGCGWSRTARASCGCCA